MNTLSLVAPNIIIFIFLCTLEGGGFVAIAEVVPKEDMVTCSVLADIHCTLCISLIPRPGHGNEANCVCTIINTCIVLCMYVRVIRSGF